jgi:PAS domain S-box-containing protein
MTDSARRSFSISVSLTVSLILTVVFVSAIAMGFNYFHSSRKAKAQLEEKADEYMKFLTESLEVPLWTYEENAVKNIGSFFAKNELVVALRISDANDTVFFEFRKGHERDVIVREQNIFHHKKFAGTIRLSMTSRYYEEISHQLLSSSVITIFIVLLALIVLTGLFLRIFLRKPLDDLGQVINRYAAGKYESSGRIFCSEFEPVVRVLEKMAREIGKRIKELSEAETKYRNIFENAVDGIFQTTPGGELLSANPALAKIMGYDSIDDMRLSVTDISKQYVHPEERLNIMQQLRHHKGNIIRYETEMYCKDKTQIRVSLSVREVCSEQGDILYYEGLLTDITERIKREKAEREREIAEKANRAKSVFLANMSHELRTPLNAVLGYAQLLQKDPNVTERQKDRLKIIHNSGDHLLSLINDILDLSKIEAGRIEITSAEFFLPDFLDNINAMFQIRADQKNIGFYYKNSHRLPKYVRGDKVRLRQILINLLGNAVKFTEKGRVTFGADYKDGHVCFEVGDTGPGIEAGELEKIFDPFYQSGSYVKKSEGTGLGLSISRRLIEIMGGSLTVESTPGQGTVFRAELELPSVSSAESISEIKNSGIITGYDGARRKILIVDDIYENRFLLSEQLISMGFEVSEADNGETAAEQTKKFQPDLILMDLFMPGTDGFEAVKIIRQAERDKAKSYVPIIAVSAGAFEEHMLKSREAGCDDFISKPVAFEKLLAKMRKYLHLEWTYQKAEESAEEKSPIIAPSSEDLESLINSAKMGDIKAIQDIAHALLHKDKQFAPFAEEIIRLAKEFQIGKIRVFLKSYE